MHSQMKEGREAGPSSVVREREWRREAEAELSWLGLGLVSGLIAIADVLCKLDVHTDGAVEGLGVRLKVQSSGSGYESVGLLENVENYRRTGTRITTERKDWAIKRLKTL